MPKTSEAPIMGSLVAAVKYDFMRCLYVFQRLSGGADFVRRVAAEVLPERRKNTLSQA